MAWTAGRAPAEPAGAPAWGVAGLLLATADLLAARFGAVTVRGEISGFSRAASGHCYFSLKDADGAPALLRCAMFRRAASLVPFEPADGQQVELRGRLAVYDARGELQLVVESLQRVGSGALYEEFLRRRARLAAEGLFEPGRKHALPTHPRRLAVVTSLQAAALRDVLATLRRRAPQVQVLVVPSAVQGAEAPLQLAQALALAAAQAGIEAVLLVRGGGSLEDLWAFNDERVVRAIVACPVPVVCGVGHETDVTLADLAADLRAPTPTAAAELAAPAQAELLDELGAMARALRQGGRALLQRQVQRLDGLALRLGQPQRGLQAQQLRLQTLEHRARRAAGEQLRSRHERLQALGLRLQQAVTSRLQREPLRLQAAAERLQAQDPARVLRRGYAWVEDAQGRPVTAVRQLVPGQSVQAVWADGRAGVQVSVVTPETPPGEGPQA